MGILQPENVIEKSLNCSWIALDFFKKNLWPPCKLMWITGSYWKIQKINLAGRSNIDIIIRIILGSGINSKEK